MYYAKRGLLHGADVDLLHGVEEPPDVLLSLPVVPGVPVPRLLPPAAVLVDLALDVGRHPVNADLVAHGQEHQQAVRAARELLPRAKGPVAQAKNLLPQRLLP